MKIARFSHDGVIAFGVVDDDDLVVLQGDPMFAGFDPTGERVALHDVTLLAPVIPRSKVIVMDRKTLAVDGPLFVLKPNTTVVGPNDSIVLPAQSEFVTATGALAIVIGKITKNVARADLDGVIFGYTIANDVTAQDLLEFDGNGSRAKSFDSFCPLGPVIDTELDLDAQMLIAGRVNDAEFQNDTAAVSPQVIGDLVMLASTFFTLLPGDVIISATAADPAEIVHGDTVQLEIPGIGVLSNPVRRAA